MAPMPSAIFRVKVVLFNVVIITLLRAMGLGGTRPQLPISRESVENGSKEFDIFW